VVMPVVACGGHACARAEPTIFRRLYEGCVVVLKMS
jgi:hypothetical protein